MFLRRHQSGILVLAVLVLGAGCGGTSAQLAPSTGGGADALPGEGPDSGALEQDAGLSAPDGPPGGPDALVVLDAWASDTGVPDSGRLRAVDAAIPDGGLPEADRPDANPRDADRTDLLGDEDALGPADARGSQLGDERATVVVLPDTQYYSASHPDIFPRQTQWIADHVRDRHIALTLHLGDLVDGYTDASQWQVASSAMRALDGKVPYVLVTGNHDMDADRVCLVSEHFAPASMPWIAGIMEPLKIENSYALVDIGPTHWLVLGLEWGPRDAVMTWANSVLQAYPERPAIIITHAYLYSSGQRYDLAVSGGDNSDPNFQWFIPQVYGYTASQGINDGEAIWQKLVEPNPNVRLVFSGHANGAMRLTSSRSDGSLVHQVLSDYQGLYSGTAEDLGGSGYMRILEFDFSRKVISVQTYSPYLDSYLTDDANQFTLSLEM